MFNTNLQYPSTNHQIITDIQIPILKDSLIIGSLELIWSLPAYRRQGIWLLEF
jgi:hypothetical protein